MTKSDLSILSAQEVRFVEAFLENPVVTEAAIAAGYSASNPAAIGGRVRWRPRVAAAIRQAQEARAGRLGITTDRVLEALAAVAFADPSELVQHRRCACRHCWGEAHLHQHTGPEQVARMNAHLKTGAPADTFDPQGGEGFDRYADPNPDCPQCMGYGEGQVILNDTRLLSDEGKALFAGVHKTARGGIELRLADRVAALHLLGRHLGLFSDKGPKKPKTDYAALLRSLDEGKAQREAQLEEEMRANPNWANAMRQISRG